MDCRSSVVLYHIFNNFSHLAAILNYIYATVSQVKFQTFISILVNVMIVLALFSLFVPLLGITTVQ